MRVKTMTLLHYSRKPLANIYSVSQNTLKRHDKPQGLWVSVEGEDDWKEWCEAESFGDINSQLVSQIILSSDASILYLAGESELDKFTDQYCYAPYPQVPNILGIKWEMVANEYQGIIIAPYVWNRRLDKRTFWYYGWDCASGCIWDATAINSVIAHSERPVPQQD